MRTRRPSRLRSFDYVGLHHYSLTYCTDRRRKWFADAETVALVWAQFLRVAERERFEILVYCFMPDHVHMVVKGCAEDSNGKDFIIKSKQCSAHAYAKAFNARLWQPFAYERVVRADEDVHRLARYILENPVRAGLAKTVLDYPFVGSQVYDVRALLDGLVVGKYA